MAEDPAKRKYLYIEALRIVACFFVVFNHTGSKGFFLFSEYAPGSLPFWIYLIPSVFCTFSVPAFFAISGALLLPRGDEDLKVLYRKRIIPIVCSLVTFSFLYYLWEISLGYHGFDITDFLVRLWEGDIVVPFWYLYAFIPYLMTLPLLRRFAQNLEDKYFVYMFGLRLLFTAILPVLQYLVWRGAHSLSGNLNIGWLADNALFYPMLGYYLQTRVKEIEKKGRLIGALWAVNAAAILISCGMTYLQVLDTGICTEGVSQTFHAAFSVINVSTMFLTFKYLFSVRGGVYPAWLNKWIASVGACTFGIYLWHTMILFDSISQKVWWQFRVEWGVNGMVSVLIQCVYTMAAGYLLTMVMKRIPLLRRLV